MTTETLALAPPPAPRRPRVQFVGTALAASGSLMFLAGLLGVYTSVRADVIGTGEAWLPPGSAIPLAPGNMSFITLLMSAAVIQWAVHSMRDNDRQHGYLALGLFLLLGFAHIVMMAFYWSEMGLAVNGEIDKISTQAILIFTITGAHLAMVGAGMIYAAFMAFRALGGQFTGTDREGVAAAALYWYAVVVGYALVWYTIFITK